MVDITRALRQAKRNERYRRMIAALEAIKAEPGLSVRVRALVDEGLDDTFDATKIPRIRNASPAQADTGETSRRLSFRADMFRFVTFATDTGEPCGHGKTHNAALADAKRNHPLRDSKARYAILEFDIASDVGKSVWDEKTPLKRARRIAVPE